VSNVYWRIINRLKKTWQYFYPILKSNLISFIKLKMLPFFKLWNLHTALAIAGIIGPLFLTVGDLTAALSTSDYSLVSSSISSLALTRIGYLQTIGFLALGLLIEIFTAGMLFNMKGARGFHLGIAIFVIFGFAMLLIGAFRTDPAGTTETARTIEGRIHGLTAQTAFTLFPFAILFLIPSIRKDPNWKNLFRYTEVTLILAVVLIVIIKVFPEPNSLFGLMERLLVANIILWVEVAAVNLFIISLKRKAKAQLDLPPTNEDY
jgi:hypothetical protein